VLGETLRKRREELKLDLRQISDTLKIKNDYLKAIEEGALERLPADVYVKGYIREYARILKLDPEAALEAYAQEIGKPQPDQQPPLLEQHTPPKKFRVLYFLLPLIILFVLVVVLWQSHVPEKPNPSEVRPPVAEPVKEPAGQPAGEPPVREEHTIQETPPVLKEPAFHMLEIHANDTTWLFVMIDQTETRELLMQPGETLQLQAKKGFSLKIGNAGGIRLVFDGKDIGRLGENGAVINIDLPHSEP
jgi:cytoskeletal protein RodZ